MVRPAGGIQRIGGHDRRGLVPAAGDQHGAAAGGGPGGDVGHAVAYEEASLQIEPMLGGGLEKHARPRFAAGAGEAIFGPRGLGVVGAVIDGIQPRAAAGLDLVENQPVQLLQIVFGQQSACDGGLVTDHGQKHPSRIQFAERGEHPFEQADLLRAEKEALVVDQHAVAIKEYGLAEMGHVRGSSSMTAEAISVANGAIGATKVAPTI